MTDNECKELGIMTDQELRDMKLKLERVEDAGIGDTQKYFDRIHDKLFSLNSLLIAGYFALVAFRKMPGWSIIIPMLNFALLLYVDYRMLKRARVQATITELKKAELDEYGKMMDGINLCSLVAIFSTIAVVAFFGYFLFSSSHPI